MVESSGLLNRRTVKSCTEGSNPSLSAIYAWPNLAGFLQSLPCWFYSWFCPSQARTIRSTRPLSSSCSRLTFMGWRRSEVSGIAKP